MTRALIVDGYELFRHSVKDLVAASGRFTVIEEASSSGGLLRAAMNPMPVELAVIHPRSIGLGEEDCLCLARRMFGDARLLLFRDRGQPAADFPESERVTVLPRDAGRQALAAAIAGLPLEPPPSAAQGETDGAGNAARFLSRRQREIMAMVAQGMPNKEIAHRLGIAEGTVKAHIHAVFRALGVTNRTQAVVRFGAALRAAE